MVGKNVKIGVDFMSINHRRELDGSGQLRKVS